MDDAARVKVKQLAENLAAGLREVDRGFIYLSQSDGETLVAALEAFLSGTAESLDEAFGVKRGRGAPKSADEASQIAIAHDVLKNRDWREERGEQPEKWVVLEATHQRDQKTLKEIRDKYRREAEVKEIVERLEKKRG